MCNDWMRERCRRTGSLGRAGRIALHDGSRVSARVALLELTRGR